MSQAPRDSQSSEDDSWENEGGSPAADQLARHGIVRQMTETYAVGGYHYTSLTDAIAQARRMAKLEREL